MRRHRFIWLAAMAAVAVSGVWDRIADAIFNPWVFADPRLVGTWDGADTLALDADFSWRRGQGGISNTDDPATQPVPMTLQRQSMPGQRIPRQASARACG